MITFDYYKPVSIFDLTCLNSGSLYALKAAVDEAEVTAVP